MLSSWVAAPDYLDGNYNNVELIDIAKLRLLSPVAFSRFDIDELSLIPQVWHVEDIHTILSLCRNNFGISNLPNFACKVDLELGKLNKIYFSFDQLNDHYWVTSILWHKNKSLNQQLKWLRDEIVKIENV